MKTNAPPSIGYQPWGLMAIFFLFMGGVGQILQIILFWPTSDWGSFLYHVVQLWACVWELLTQHSWSQLEHYCSWLDTYGIRNRVLLTAVGTFIISLLFAFSITRAVVWVPGGRKSLIKICGPTLYEDASIQSGLRLRRLNSSQRSGIAVHPNIQLSKKECEGNVLVFGQQGSGKSVIIKTILKQIVSNKNIAVIYDEKREFTELFYDPADTILIAPWDERSSVWDISKDLRCSEDFELIAKMLVTDRAEDPMWSNGARAILAGIFSASCANGQNN